MKIELRKISDIKPYPQNPRVNDGVYRVLCAHWRLQKNKKSNGADCRSSGYSLIAPLTC